MKDKIKVAILDDHPTIVDGYVYRLSSFPEIEVVSTLSFGGDLERTLADRPTDVLLLDVNVPTAPDNPNPYPILHAIPSLLQAHQRLSILVISMYAERGLIRAVMEAGASGYILKDDQTAARDLGNIILSVAGGGIYFSQKAHQLYMRHLSAETGFLSSRQLEALSLSAAYPDSTTADLAEKMRVSNSTVRNLLSGAYMKLEVHNRSAAIARARQLGLISSEAPTIPTFKK
ncbi:MAG: response regulator transcription factor [Chloroflexota bacterium]